MRALVDLLTGELTKEFSQTSVMDSDGEDEDDVRVVLVVGLHRRALESARSNSTECVESTRMR